jgi:hypothetical protein
MSKERQLELNFDDPVEYLAPPTYLGGVTQRAPDKPASATVIHVKARVTAQYVPAKPETGRRGQ